MSAALDCALEGISGDMDTPEHIFEMKLLDGDNDKKTEVSDEESDERKRDEDRNNESELSDDERREEELGENDDILNTADRPPSRVT